MAGNSAFDSMEVLSGKHILNRVVLLLNYEKYGTWVMVMTDLVSGNFEVSCTMILKTEIFRLWQ